MSQIQLHPVQNTPCKMSVIVHTFYTACVFDNKTLQKPLHFTSNRRQLTKRDTERRFPPVLKACASRTKKRLPHGPTVHGTRTPHIVPYMIH